MRSSESNLGASGSVVQEQKKEIDFFSAVGTHPNLTPSPSSGNGGEALLRQEPVELHSGTKYAMPVETHILTSSTERRRKDKVHIKSYVDSGPVPPNPPQTNLLKNSGAHGSPDSPINLENILSQAVFGKELVHDRTPPRLANLDRILKQTIASVEARQPRTTLVDAETVRNILHPMPGGNPASFRQPVTEQSESNFVHIATRREKHPVNSVSTLTEEQMQLQSFKKSQTDKNSEELASRQKDIVIETVSNPQRINGLKGQPSSSCNGQFARLEFTYEVLKSENLLPEDKEIIGKIRALNPNEKKKIILYENNYKYALKIFQDCASIIKAKAPHFWGIVGEKQRKLTYVHNHTKKLWEHRGAWLEFWKKKTKINLETEIPLKSKKKMEKLLLVFLFYVEMIEAVLPLEGHDPNFLESAIEFYQAYRRKEQGDDASKFAKVHYNTLLWRILTDWIPKSGRLYASKTFLRVKEDQNSKNFQVFFNRLFCLSIENFNKKILEGSLMFHQE
ncbi:hypothetical protein PtB15_1B730 [Puccinia triticina]|nr:hypothetical protein PtB15_1B730 [Puccinia triticina]